MAEHMEMNEAALKFCARLVNAMVDLRRELGRTYTELNRGVAVLVLGADGNDLTAVYLQHRNRYVRALVGKDAGHADLLSDHSGTHARSPLELGLDVDAGRQVELHQGINRFVSWK